MLDSIYFVKYLNIYCHLHILKTKKFCLKVSCSCMCNMSFNKKSKTVPLLSPIHKEGNKPCFINTINYGCTIFTSCVNFINENTLSEPKVTLYFIVSYISLVKYCCFYENRVCINSIVNSQCETETNMI